ncbi:hypothetical protein MNBD_GAMMA13-937 [hydrothermal vent metagenome]|uniref:Uncharacterized protein n=1 Tax=hydrothermal vent metagenome TaxID=652676 RepID=A0A3B0YPJ7_9ZZZZ
MKKQVGFTLIELVAVLVILALLGAMAVPRFANIQNNALEAAQDGSSNAVKSAHAIAIANLKQLPSITVLAAHVGGDGANPTAVATGVQVTINGSDFVVPTFTNSTCDSPTSAVDDIVACVGSI